MYAFTVCFFILFINEIFIVLFKTNKNPEENPDLPMDFKNLYRKLKV
jgi:hypothetical protein